MRRTLAGSMVAILLALGACDLGPEGPGSFAGAVAGTRPVGAVLLEVTGVGIEGFEGEGDTRVVGAPMSSTEGRHRVILVSPTGEVLRFSVRVSDLSLDKPVVQVISASSVDNLPMLTTGIKVRIAR